MSDNQSMRCWCGNDALSPFSGDYRRCDACQTLVSMKFDATYDPRVKNDAADYYGRDYWFDHQTKDLDCPDIVSRSRTDLSERCLHWLRSLLGYKLPPARVLEIGCAHGGFVAMLRQLGYDAFGLELSPEIIEYARKTFDISVLAGPIEDQDIAPQSLDGIVMMDVMEHLPKPIQTLHRCIELLKPDGILLIQMPEYPEGKGLTELQSEGSKFLRMLDPNEHLYLFSKRAVTMIFRRLEAPNVEFIPAVFAAHDMSFVVSKNPISKQSIEAQERFLSATMNGRLMQAMLDLDDRRLNLLRKYRQLARSTSDNHS
jgi:2-polyprenyl-3-methyl-5-hydroxy-6-metoxy-1,4-benzoquinol methylase